MCATGSRRCRWGGELSWRGGFGKRGRSLEFLEASNDVREKLDAAVLQGEVDRVYLRWGLEAMEGLEIDGETATTELLIEKGPADLSTEILKRIRSECVLSESERKN